MMHLYIYIPLTVFKAFIKIEIQKSSLKEKLGAINPNEQCFLATSESIVHHLPAGCVCCCKGLKQLGTLM